MIDRRGCRLHFAEGRTKAVGSKGIRVSQILECGGNSSPATGDVHGIMCHPTSVRSSRRSSKSEEKVRAVMGAKDHFRTSDQLEDNLPLDPTGFVHPHTPYASNSDVPAASLGC